ncbi:Cytochrome bo(3) ubiquinol oxidase subunit 2 precursor [Roseovarius albus]|uniref:Ubiquinol oxidase subunit 2 n=1 Tax=Roseovarius albus TaxID=1247867 RepID=A0A1X6ZTD9_9RHOB|nr:ubiquinol oxidase subunit II [Roseovarius albus]SLN60937.1 Cytochrome bo(3) ubiquinol oxidase subunit 2 precursor [Roseovarius albus]
MKQVVTGPIAEAENALMWQAFSLMLVVVVPVILLTLFVAWRYRAAGGQGAYKPDWDRSRIIEITVWGIPIVMIGILATWVWDRTHALDPYKQLPGAEPLRIEAIALDWKWLFIYPDLNIATVNQVAFPVEQPLSFRITSEVAMNSFMIPALGGQIYAMAGMETQLNLQANEIGAMQGRNMQFSGDGFSDQTFEALSMSQIDFEAWVNKVRSGDSALDQASFAELSKPSIDAPIAYFSTVPQDFFSRRVAHFMGMEHEHAGHSDGGDK